LNYIITLKEDNEVMTYFAMAFYFFTYLSIIIFSCFNKGVLAQICAKTLYFLENDISSYN